MKSEKKSDIGKELKKGGWVWYNSFELEQGLRVGYCKCGNQAAGSL
jgi:hypothetical protein